MIELDPSVEPDRVRDSGTSLAVCTCIDGCQCAIRSADVMLSRGTARYNLSCIYGTDAGTVPDPSPHNRYTCSIFPLTCSPWTPNLCPAYNQSGYIVLSSHLSARSLALESRSQSTVAKPIGPHDHMKLVSNERSARRETPAFVDRKTSALAR